MLEITADVYAWLTSIDMFESDRFYESSIANFSINEKGNVILEEKFQIKIKTGIFFVKLFEKINTLLNTLYGNIYRMDERIYNLLEDNSAHIKLKNFEIILDFVKNYYGIILDSDYKTFLVASDNSTLLDFFNKLYNFYVEIEMKIRGGKNRDQRSGNVDTINKKNASLNADTDVNINASTNADQRSNNNKGSNNKNDIHYNLDKISYNNFETENQIVIKYPTDNLNSSTSNLHPEKSNYNKLRFREDYVDLDELENRFELNKKQITHTRTVLEFIIISICTSFNMTPKQSAALLADNKKYLTHILVKGLAKQNFKPIKQFYQEVLSNLNHFIQLIEINSIAYPNQISKNIEMSLSTFKPGLLSKSLDVVYVTGRVLTKLAFEFIDKNLISSAWDWFVMPGGGLEASILCLKKHNSAVEVVVSLITNFGRYHLFELFSIYLKSYLQNEGSYFNFLSDIIEKLSHLKFFTDEFIKNKIKSFFLDLIDEGSQSFNINCKLHCISFLSELWINFSIYIEDEEENFKILNTLKKMTRDGNKLVQYASFTQLFRILAIFAKERNSFAPTIYKTLTFNLIENHDEFQIKEFIISNFSNIFKIIMSIPVGILVEPYIKQINVSLGTSYIFNLIDINFLTTLTRHPRLNIKDSIIILDILGKIYFEIDNGIYFYQIIRNVFTMIISRYLIHEVGIEFCFKYSKVLIETFCRLDKPNSDKIYVNAIAMNSNPDNVENEINLPISNRVNHVDVNLKQITKSAIIEMIIDILQINNSFINNIIKSLLICADLRHFRIYEFHNLGISKALDHFGNPNDIVHYFNINEEDLDVDKEFEIVVELIYDRPPIDKSKFIQAIRKEEQATNIDKLNINTNIVNNPTANEQYNRKDQDKFVKIKREQIKLMKLLDNKEKRKSKSKNVPNLQNNKLIVRKNINENIFQTIDNNYELLDISKEEDRDLIELKKLIKDYHRFFRYIYFKYSGSIFHPINGKVFNSIKEIAETIAPSEIVNIFRDHNVLIGGSQVSQGTWGNTSNNRLIYKHELLILIGLMNTKVFKKANTKSGINYEEFIEIFIQISYFCFNRPPHVYSKYTIAQYTHEMIKLFSNNIQISNLVEFNIVEYQHPDNLITPYEKQICDNLNKQLAKTNIRNTSIPEKYKKYLDTELNHKYYVPDCMRTVFTQAQIICIELVDEIIHKSLQIHSLESFSFVKEIYKVRPVYIPSKLPIQLQINVEEIKTLKLEKIKRGRVRERDRDRPPLDKNRATNKPKKITPRLREILNKVNSKSRNDGSISIEGSQAKGITSINEDVENNENNQQSEDQNENDNENDNSKINIEDSNLNVSNKIKETTVKTSSRNLSKYGVNNIKLNRIIEEERKKQNEKENEHKRKLRVQYIKQELSKMKEQKKEKDGKHELLISEEKKKKEEKIKNKMDEETKLREKIKKELEKIKQNKLEEEKAKFEREKKIKLEQAKKIAELDEVFNNKQILKFQNEFKKISEVRKTEDLKKKEESKNKLKKFKEDKIKFNEYLEKEKKVRENEKKMYSEIDKLLDRPDIRKVFEKYEEHVNLLMEVYSTTKNSSVNKNTKISTTGIHLDEYQNFNIHFNITNLLLEPNDLQSIFKKISNKKSTTGHLEIDGFKLVLIYTCLFSIKNFKNVNPIHEEDNNKSGSPTEIKINSIFSNINEDYINAMDGNTMTSFFEFLGLKVPYIRREIENYINIQKNISVKDKTKLIKEKSSGLINYQGDISRIKNSRAHSGHSRMLSENSVLV